MKFDAVKELGMLLDGVRDHGGTVTKAHEEHAIRLLEEKIRADERLVRPEGGSPWNAAIDAAIRIAERAWVEENSLTGSKVAKKIAESIRDLRTEPQRLPSSEDK